jgi:hypothetical protein
METEPERKKRIDRDIARFVSPVAIVIGAIFFIAIAGGIYYIF